MAPSYTATRLKLVRERAGDFATLAAHFTEILARQLRKRVAGLEVANAADVARIEDGQHSVRINITDEDGRLVVPSLDGNITIKFGPNDQSAVTNLVLNIW